MFINNNDKIMLIFVMNWKINIKFIILIPAPVLDVTMMSKKIT